MYTNKRLRNRGLISTGHHIPYNPKLKYRARKLRQSMTYAEQLLWNGFLRDFKSTVLRQKPLDHYIVDFYCAKAKLVIEVDGDVHVSEEAKRYDAVKDEILGSHGLKVLRVPNDDVIHRFDEVCNEIEAMYNERVSKSPCNPPLG